MSIKSKIEKYIFSFSMIVIAASFVYMSINIVKSGGAFVIREKVMLTRIEKLEHKLEFVESKHKRQFKVYYKSLVK